MTDLRDDDLSDALRPLAGNPAEDWARVLAALPLAAPRTRPIWPWIAAAAAAGVLVGWLASLVASRPDAIGDGPTGTQAAIGDNAEVARLIGRDGDTFVETDSGPLLLQVADPIAMEHFVATAPEARAFVRLPGDVELRMAGGSRVLVLGRRSLELARGRLFVRVPETSGPVSVAMIEGELLASPGAVQLTVRSDLTEIVALEGSAVFTDLAGERIELDAGRRLRSSDGIVGGIETVDLPYDHVAWQIELLAGCPDHEKEAFGWLMTLVDALDEPGLSERAERALRGAGEIAALTLGMALYELPDERSALRRRCWQILAEIGSAASLPYLLAGPRDAEPEVRVRCVEAIERITGVPSGQDAAFWRDAPSGSRLNQLVKWEERLRSF